VSIALSFSLFSFVTVDSFGVVVFVIRQMADLTNTPTPQAVINTNVGSKAFKKELVLPTTTRWTINKT
jgi:hypothetical protein